MSRRLPAFLLTVALSAVLCMPGAAGAARLYVPDYGSGPPEQIGAFDLNSDGSLAQLPGSPFPAVTAGILGLRNVAFTPDGTRAATGFFGADGGVQGYSVPASGIFTLTNTFSPTASVTAIAITPDGRYAYASTREFGGKPAEGIYRFAMGADGSLTSLGPPTPIGTDSYDVVVSPDGRFLFAEAGSDIARFAIQGDGSLVPLGMTPVPTVSQFATSFDERFLYVYLESGGEPGLAVFEIGGDGGLAQRGMPVSLGPGSSGSDFAVAPSGRYAFLADSNSGGLIATVAIAADGSPTLLPARLQAAEVESMIVSPDDRHLVYYHQDPISGFVLDVAAIGEGGSLTMLPSTTRFGDNEGARMSFQPQPTPAAKFTFRASTPGQATSFDATGSTGTARYDWDFGDGTTLSDGGPTPTHTYAQAGVYDVALSVFDLNGCAARHYYDGHSTVCPGGSGTTATASVDTLPELGQPKAVPRKFVPKAKGAKRGGTSFRYTVSEPSGVRFTIERKRIGRLVGKKCKLRTAKNAGRRKCPLFKRVGSLTQKAKAGANRLKWSGKLKGKPLPPGPYRATVVAIDSAGAASASRTVGFRILSLP